jgi:2-C-methyl-D-erythritol 4-phosphate cytidylyltransferase
MSKVAVLVPAAGSGRRMGSAVAKQFLPLGGRPLLAHTLQAFERSPEIDEIIPILSEADRETCLRSIIEPNRFSKVRTLVVGGKERQDSVRRGIEMLGQDVEIVLVHDGVRPFVTPAMIVQCVAHARQGECVAVGVPLKDTVKEVDERGMVRATLERSRLWAVQTPQAFPARILRQAYEDAHAKHVFGTDDATLVERAGHPVRIIMGSYENIKVTTPEDLVLAEEILKGR